MPNSAPMCRMGERGVAAERPMVEIGSIIRAKVTRVEPYGVYLDYAGQSVCVLAPDVSWHGKGDLRQRVKIGEEIDVRVMRYNYRDHVIVASIRLLHPEENPYRQLARLEPGTILQARITLITREDVTLDLGNDAWGHMPTYWLQPGLKKGDTVEVEIAGIEVDEGRLWLEPAGHAPRQANSSSTQPTTATA